MSMFKKLMEIIHRAGTVAKGGEAGQPGEIAIRYDENGNVISYAVGGKGGDGPRGGKGSDASVGGGW